MILISSFAFVNVIQDKPQISQGNDLHVPCLAPVISLILQQVWPATSEIMKESRRRSSTYNEEILLHLIYDVTLESKNIEEKMLTSCINAKKEKEK